MSKEKILDSLKENICIEKMKKINKRESQIKRILRSSFVVCITGLSVSGIVFAKDISTKIYENFFHTGNGMAVAINEGYIEKSDMEYQTSNIVVENEETGQVIEDADTNIKVDSFLMDDFNLSVTFDVEFSDKIKDIITEKEVFEMNFPDMIIYDENDVVMLLPTGIKFNEFCKEKNLPYTYETCPDEKCIGSGYNVFVTEKDDKHVRVVYNIYTGGNMVYPKSKKIYANIGEIRVSKNESLYGQEEISIKGDWDLEVDVPEKMYGRKNITYLQKNTTDENYKITSAILYNTGIKTKLEVTGYKKPENIKFTPEYEFYNSLPEDSEFKTNEIFSYLSEKLHNTEENVNRQKKYKELYDFEIYITNKKGEEFKQTVGPSPNGSTVIGDDNIIKRETMFDLTKYDEADEITVHINHHGKEVKIVLEKN